AGAFCSRPFAFAAGLREHFSSDRRCTTAGFGLDPVGASGEQHQHLRESVAKQSVTKRADRETEEDLVRLYLDDIGKHELLTKEGEARLAQRIENGKAARTELNAPDAKLTAAKRRELRRLVRDGANATQAFIN